MIITINRGSFSPTELVGWDWSAIEAETDTRSTALSELDLTKVHHVRMLEDGETHITGEENLKRLKVSGHIRLDANIFMTLWKNQDLIPESWKERINNNARFIYFDGTVLQSTYGRRCVLCLYWRGGNWLRVVHLLDYDRSACYVSAVLPA